MDQHRWLTADEERAWRGYRRMRTLLDLQITRDLAALGLSDADYDVLSTLTEADDHRWRANELAAHLRWSSSRLSHHVGRMERRGLVAREAVPGDRRGSSITLTPAGWAVLQSAAREHVASVRRHFIDLMTPDQLATLEAITRTVNDHLGAAVSDDRPSA